MSPDSVEVFLTCRRSLLAAAADALAAVERLPRDSGDVDPVDRRVAEGLLETLSRLVALLDVHMPDLALARLLAAAPGWEHPAEILERPRPSYRLLARLAAERLAEADPAPRRLRVTLERLERAARIEEAARRRREALSGISSKKPGSLGTPRIEPDKQ